VWMGDRAAPQSRDEAARPAAESAAQPSPPTSHLTNWHVDLYLYEGDEGTAAHAVLHGASQERLDSRGTARHRTGEANVPDIGNEVAVARTLRSLADRLLATASDDMSAVEGHPVTSSLEN
jgi:Rv2632c-like